LFEGAQRNLSFHKAWTSICKYLLKEDKDLYIWGSQTLSKIRETVKAQESHKRLPRRSQVIISKLKSFDEWYRVYEDPEVSKTILSSYNSVRSVFEDMRIQKDRESHLQDRISDYLKARS